MSKCGLFGCSGKRPVRDLVARGLFGFFVNGSASARPPASLLAAGVLVVALLSGAGTAGAQSAPAFSSSASFEKVYTVGEAVSSSGNTLPAATGGFGTFLNYNLYNVGTTTTATLPNGLSYTAPNWQDPGDGNFVNNGATPGGTITGTPTAATAATQYDLIAGDLTLPTPQTAKLTISIRIRAAAPSFGSASALPNKVYAVGQTVSESLPAATGGTPSLIYAFYNAGTTTTATLPDGLSYTAPTDTSTGGTITGTATAAKLSACYALTVSDSESTPRTATFNNVVCIAVAQPETEAPPSPTQQPPPAPSEPEEPASPAEEPRTVDLMPEFVPNTFAAQNYEQDVRISPVALPGARGGDAPLRYALSPALPDGLSFDEATRVVSGTPSETVAATVYTLTATDADGDAATLTFTITVEPRASAERALGEINRAVMPELARSMTSSALDAVAGRIEDATSAAGGGKTAARPAVRGYYGIPSEETYDVPAGLSREALGDMSFSVSLAGGDMDDFPAEGEDVPLGEPEPGRIAVWAVGDYGRLSGKQSMIDYKGGVFAGHLGTDVRLGPDFVIGVAASWFEGSFDYTDGRNETAVDGEIKSRMTGFYPYMSWSLTEAFSMWAAAGWGFGEIKIEDKDISGRQKGDAIMRTGAAGGKLRLISKAGAFSGGLTTVDLKGEAWLTRLNVESNDDRIEGLTTDVNRLRLALRGAHELSLRSGSSITPSLEFGVRRDGGDGETGFGAELGGRLAYFSPALGLTVEMNGRGLLAHEGDNKNWALGGGIRYDRGADRRGLSFSMLPSYGETESRVRELWERGVTGDAGGGDLSFGLDTEVGYGFAALGGRGLLIPYGGVAPRYGDGRSYRLGSRLEIGRRLDLRLEGERLERDAGQSGHELILSGRMNW